MSLNYLDEVSNLKPVVRLNWMDKPDLPVEDYVYCPAYSQISGVLLYNYEESDQALRKRVKAL